MRSRINDNLECSYGRFKERVGEDLSDEKVDYFGINISDDVKRDGEFKIYYKDVFSRKEVHPLIDFLSGNDMIQCLAKVNDKGDKKRLRLDVGMKNRTNENMEKMFGWLDENIEIFRNNKKQIRKLSSMRMTDKKGFEHASFYFIGFIAVNSNIEVLKVHFYNRICDEPDELYDNYHWDDNYYLGYLKASEIQAFSDLVDIIHSALRYCGGHLWATGVDYQAEGAQKYKIYIKRPWKPYDGLEAVFVKNKNRVLRERIESVKVWNEEHSCFKCVGFAICLDNKSELSINFYYIMVGDDDEKAENLLNMDTKKYHERKEYYEQRSK